MPFMGGPLDGQQVSPDTLGQAHQGGMVDLQALAAGMPPGAGAPPQPDGSAAPPDTGAGTGNVDQALSEGQRLDRILSDMLAVAGGTDLSEQDKASIQQAMSLVQRIKASEEKQTNDALGGKVSPQLLQKAYAGG